MTASMAAAIYFAALVITLPGMEQQRKLTRPAPGPQHTDLQNFDARSFVKPEPFFWPGYMWVWNDEITKRNLTEQMEDMASQGALTVTPLPEPAEFRPTFMPTRMSPPYMSGEFMARVRHMGDEAKRLGMRIWLYDEGGWPSGSVCGRLVKEHPNYARQALKRSEIALHRGQCAAAPPGCITAFLAEPGAPMVRVAIDDTRCAASDDARLVVFTAEIGGRYPDLLNPGATREFLRLTHEPYRAAISDLFGDVAPLIFTDEPSIANPPWTDGLAEDFTARKGYDLRDHLPSIFGGDTDADRKVRIDFFDWWSARFAEAFFGQIQDWCRWEGILSGGHVGGDDETLGSSRYGYGHILRTLRRLDVPGVDVIWRQVWPGKQNHHFPKYASTVARQENLRYALTESFAVFGNGLTPAQMKWITDYQLVRGINLMTMIGYPLSTADWMLGGERPHYTRHTPMWQDMHRFHGYVARLCYALSLGKATARTAVYLPVRDLWAGGAEAPQAAAANDLLAAALLERQCDYDFVDDDALERTSTTVRDRALQVGAMAYDTVYVSRTRWMTEAAREKLAALAHAGGRVIWVDPTDAAAVTPGARSCALAEAAGLAVPVAVVEPANPGIRITSRELANGRLFFVTNETTGPVNCTVRFPDTRRAQVLDPETGTIAAAIGGAHVRGGTRIRLALPYAGSRALLFSASSDDTAREAARAARPVLELREGWKVRPVREYRLTSSDMDVRPVADAAPAAIPLGDWRPVVGEGFSGDAEYTVRFQCTGAVARAARVLDFGDVRYSIRVTLNGHDLGARLWEPFAVPVAGLVVAGENELRVVVTNTLANQYVTSKALDRWTPAQLGPYHPRALVFEKDSLPSGLYGPVRLLAE